MEDWNEQSKQTNIPGNSFSLSSNSIEKKYLLSALTARLIAAGFKDPKNIKSVINYIRGLEKNYSGMRSPYYFEKFSKFNGKYFWSPYLPLFYSRAFEKYILSEINSLTKEKSAMNDAGIAVLDFATCRDEATLKQVISEYGEPGFELPAEVYKVYIRWPQWANQTYVLSRFLEKFPPNVEKWLVFDREVDISLFPMLSDRYVRGILLNTSDSENGDSASDELIRKIGEAALEQSLILGINSIISDTQDEYMEGQLLSKVDTGVQFLVWTYQSAIQRLMNPGTNDALNKAAIERFFLKSNSNKNYKQSPILFYPEFFNRISLKGRHISKNFAYFSFRDGINASSVVYRELFRFLQIPIEKTPLPLRLAK